MSAFDGVVDGEPEPQRSAAYEAEMDRAEAALRRDVNTKNAVGLGVTLVLGTASALAWWFAPRCSCALGWAHNGLVLAMIAPLLASLGMALFASLRPPSLLRRRSSTLGEVLDTRTKEVVLRGRLEQSADGGWRLRCTDPAGVVAGIGGDALSTWTQNASGSWSRSDTALKAGAEIVVVGEAVRAMSPGARASIDAGGYRDGVTLVQLIGTAYSPVHLGVLAKSPTRVRVAVDAFASSEVPVEASDDDQRVAARHSR